MYVVYCQYVSVCFNFNREPRIAPVLRFSDVFDGVYWTSPIKRR